MRTAIEREVPVLVAGAGPAGLMAAAALARHGVESLVIERRHELSGLPRATVVSMRSMELMRAWGLEDEIRAGGVEAEWLMWSCETLARAAAGSGLPVGIPTSEQAAVISPTSPACVPQDHLEPVLLRHLRSLGPSRVEFGSEVIAVESDADGVRTELRDARSGEVRAVRARYLVAADGAHSAVRSCLGVPMRGPDNLAEVVTAQFHAPLWDVVGDHRYGIYDVTHAEAGGVFLPAGPGDRWLYGQRWEPGRERARNLTEERLARLIELGAGVPGLRPRIERTGRFTFAAQMADRFREGSTFLVGDAAHRVTPRGGTGMNTAIHDGFDLGWKLSWVLRGWAEESLLDSYERERRPIAEHNRVRSIDVAGSIRQPGEELHADLGGRITHLWVPSPSGSISTLDLLGPGLTLFTGPEGGAPETDAGSPMGSPPLTVQRLDAISARALGIHPGDTLLVRPDGTPAARWTHAAETAMPVRELAVA